MDGIQKSLERLRSFSVEDATETGLLRSRIDEQSGLICMLKQRADEVLLRCLALQKINTESEEQVLQYQKELDSERKKAELIEKRFMDLASNNQAIIAFMDEHKHQNVQLKLENQQLQSENKTLFSKKLQDKEVFVQKLMQEIKQLTEKYEKRENEYSAELAGCKSKILEQTTQHENKEASLLNQFYDSQQQQRDAVEMCNEATKSRRRACFEGKQHERKHNKPHQRERQTTLLVYGKGKVIQEKQEEIKQLETKWKEEKKAWAKAEHRFEKEAEAVNADVKVKSLQCALDESMKSNWKQRKDFEAFKEHSTNLLMQERELNKKLRHMMG
ncbi:hypothetical protein F7725_001892 [Dissostichus mawsoni]|uniref:Coiled-coil domain-containing protein 89 n=1 Tax=Dissostichus mawsoni TaxID=36200 RepID=A0A7J5Y1T3_DISMA|nr:hypothetical protein F7725_001892 [Dissostichus mawsoni]